MNFFNSAETYFGLFETHTLIKSFRYRFEEFANAIDKVSAEDGKTYSQAWPKLTEEEITIVATDVHEQDHFVQFISTPFGILLWRCYQVLIRDTLTFLTFFESRGIEVDTAGCSLLEWWDKKGRNHYSRFRKEDKNYLEQFVIQEIVLTDTFLDILTAQDAETKYSNYTIGEFVGLVNDLYPRLAMRSALTWKVRWKTEMPADTPLFDYNSTCGFNALPILEGMSKIRERIVLLKDQASSTANLESWKKSLHGYYKVGYDYAIKTFLPIGMEPEVPRHLGHAHHNYILALCGNIDLVCTQYSFDELYIEAEFPWFRCRQLEDQRVMLELQAYVKQTLNCILSKNELFNQFSNWDTQEIRLMSTATGNEHGVPPLFRMSMKLRAQHFRQVEQHFFKAHRLLLHSLQSNESVGNEIQKLNLIDEYSDRFVFINTPGSDDANLIFSWIVPIHIAYQQHFILNLLYGAQSKPPIQKD